MNDQQLVDYWRQDRYGDFVLTDAIRPALEITELPRQGFRLHPRYCTPSGIPVPALTAAVSREHLFAVFLELLDPLGEVLDTVLETSHEMTGDRHRDLYRWQIDLPVLKSYFWEFEDLLLNDGCTGVAVIGSERLLEVQFDEHKVLTVFAQDLQPFVDTLLAHGVYRDDRLKLISESAHLHSTDQRHAEAFEQLCCQLGVSEAVSTVPW